MKQLTIQRLFLLLFLLCAASAWAADSSYTFQSGTIYGRTYDGWLNSGSYTTSFSSDATLKIEDDTDTTSGGGYNYRAIVRMDSLDERLSGRTIDSAFVYLVASGASSDAFAVTIHRIKESWVDNGSGSYHYSPSWRYKNSLDETPDIEWTTGGCPPNGTTAQINAEGAAVTILAKGTYRWTLTAATVRAWVDTSSVNYGLIFVPGGTTVTGTSPIFHSSESATTASRPKIVVWWHAADGAPPATSRRRILNTSD